MVNFLIAITDNAKSFREMIFSLVGNDEFKISVGIRKSIRKDLELTENENLEIFEFADNAKREEIVNALSLNLEAGEVIVARKPLTAEELNQFLQSKADITVCKENRGKVKNFFHSLCQKILKLCLGVRVYDGDSSVIKFNENIGAVLIQTNDVSYATRVDRWKGLTTESVDVKSQPVKPEIDKKAITKCSIWAGLSLIVAVLTTVLVCIFTKVGIIAGMLLFCLDAICLAVILLMLVMIGFNVSVGKKHNDRAEVLNRD